MNILKVCHTFHYHHYDFISESRIICRNHKIFLPYLNWIFSWLLDLVCPVWRACRLQVSQFAGEFFSISMIQILTVFKGTFPCPSPPTWTPRCLVPGWCWCCPGWEVWGTWCSSCSHTRSPPPSDSTSELPEIFTQGNQEINSPVPQIPPKILCVLCFYRKYLTCLMTWQVTKEDVI